MFEEEKIRFRWRLTANNFWQQTTAQHFLYGTWLIKVLNFWIFQLKKGVYRLAYRSRKTLAMHNPPSSRFHEQQSLEAIDEFKRNLA